MTKAFVVRTKRDCVTTLRKSQKPKRKGKQMDELIRLVVTSKAYTEAILCGMRVEMERGEVYRDSLVVTYKYDDLRIQRLFEPQMSSTLIEFVLNGAFESIREAVLERAKDD
jgi:hypothetical protein